VAGPVEIGFEWMGWIGALLLEAQGRKPQALHELGQTWDLIAPVRYVQATARAMGPDLVRMATEAGDHQRAASVTEELERSGPRAGTPTAKGLALRCRGLLDDDVGALLAAVAAHRQGPRPYPLAAACEDAGVCLGRVARTGEAVSLLREAKAIYERLHASWDVARVQASLRSLGVRRIRPARRPTFGWESLTPTEVRVVDLVAEGMTNPEIAERLFVSRRTVATHLEHVFQKLGHANRVELAADAARRVANEGPTPPAGSAPGGAPASPRSQAPVRRGG
jgi:DNA-binding CsgD family transcriptional regulator